MLALALTVSVLSQIPSWNDVDTLAKEQKLEAASKAVEARLADARAKKDDAELAKALVRLTQLRIGLAGFETAVQRLRAEAWPTALVPRLEVQLADAIALETYLDLNSYEIGRREFVGGLGAKELSKQTTRELAQEIDRAYAEAWKQRDKLGLVPMTALPELTEANNYGRGVRDTLRDVVAYFWVRWLARSNYWTPEQSNELWRVDFPALVAGGAKIDPADPAPHPLVRLAALLDEHETWHLAQGHQDGALAARLERLERLRAAFTSADQRRALESALAARVTADAAVPFSAWARASLAQWQRERGALLEARDTAKEGMRAFAGTPGAQRCQALVAELEAPGYSLEGMRVDGAGRPSLQVTARNLPSASFRAYEVDLDSVLKAKSWGFAVPQERLRALLATKPLAEWTQTLTPTPDLQLHRTVFTPPIKKPGLWAVIASARPDFADDKNQLVALPLFVSSLAMSVQLDDTGGGQVAVVRDGATGAPKAGVKIELWGGNWETPRSVVATAVTDKDGVARLKATEKMTQGKFGYLTVARSGEDLVVSEHEQRFFVSEPPPVEAALVFTDRSVYRPGQKLLWKVVAYQGKAKDARYQVSPGTKLTVVLQDANYQEVASTTVTTNAFGSAAGSFELPLGRLLGRWSVHTRGGSSEVRVEEYKRPTFEVSFKDAAAGAKLNAPVTLLGEARYVFGLPVASGKVKWRVQRAPVYPWWWWNVPSVSPQVVGVGEAQVKPDGTFAVSFTPAADPKASRDVTYSFTVDADLTDDAGETRSASKRLRLGFVSVQAAFSKATGFFREGQPMELAVQRSDLDGSPSAGKGTWRVVSLKQPGRTLLPAEEPVDVEPGATPERQKAARDEVRARFNPGFDAAATLRRFGDGDELGKGEVQHDAAGQATLTLPALPAGAWRVRYETKDASGTPFTMATEVLVAGRDRSPANLPLVLELERSALEVGGTARWLVSSGLEGQSVLVELYRAGALVERRWLTSGKDPVIVERLVKPEDRGGFLVVASVVRDWQRVRTSRAITVPWTDRALTLDFATFRDRLTPGAPETFRITVKGAKGTMEAGAAEVLASMYDQSLDLFGPHVPPSTMSLWPARSHGPTIEDGVGAATSQWLSQRAWFTLPSAPMLRADLFQELERYGVGGPGARSTRQYRMGFSRAKSSELLPASAPAPAKALKEIAAGMPPPEQKPAPEGPPPPQVRTNFSETAFWAPQLLTDAKGQVAVEFKVPDSVTKWKVWAAAVTKDLRGGAIEKTTRSVKDLMVRPALPRFLREGDRASLKIAINDASPNDLKGELVFELLDPQTQKSVLAEFGVASAAPMPFTVKAGEGTTVTVPLVAPRRVGEVLVKIVAKAGGVSDGEQRPLPLLPSRVRLSQSRFAALHDAESRTLRFDDLAKTDDPSRVDEQLVVTIEAQLFDSVLAALPYLAKYPYECTEQTLNRFLSTAIVSGVFRSNPALASMAKAMSTRTTRLETFDAVDPNRKLALEESPWLAEAKGGEDKNTELVAMLDPKAVEAERASALAKLVKAQTSEGGFPWFPGGPPSPYMTLYLLSGFARAAEADVLVPKEVVQKAWTFVGEDYRRNWARCLTETTCSAEHLTQLVYVASSFPDESWLGGALGDGERAKLLDYAFARWTKHSPILKGYLALALKRAGRDADAKKVFDAVMDSAKTTPDEGTFWQPEPRAWLWYNDTLEGHALALRVLMELDPKDPRRAGLVQWLLLNKKLGHWKSTRATAEVIAAVVKYLSAEKALSVREESKVVVGKLEKRFVFEPNTFAGKKTQWTIPGPELDPKTMSAVTVSKATKGLQFATATWHFSTENPPAKGDGDFFKVSRAYFKREKQGSEARLTPLTAATKLEPGDEVEVQLTLEAKQAAEYVHVRDPRGAGFEPENAQSRFRWDQGVGVYEEYRDSATNFFLETMPAGVVTLKYRVRVAMSGTFKLGPATLQSMYAPELTAYSAGATLSVATGGK